MVTFFAYLFSFRKLDLSFYFLFLSMPYSNDKESDQW